MSKPYHVRCKSTNRKQTCPKLVLKAKRNIQSLILLYEKSMAGSHSTYQNRFRRRPTHRRASKHSYSFSGSPLELQLAIWDQVWRNSDGFWLRVHAFFFLERNMNKPGALEAMWPVIVKWQDQVDDWPHIKSTSSIAFTIAIEKMSAQLKAQLKVLRKK
jgi:hypothetical protein